MTVAGLHQDIIKRAQIDQNNGKNKHSFSDLLEAGDDAFVIGIDVSIWLHQILTYQQAADQFHTIPNIPCEAVLKVIKDRLRNLSLNKLSPLMVFDGFNNPLKASTHSDRVKKANDVHHDLKRLLRDGRPQSFECIKKLQKLCAQICPDLIADIKQYCEQNGVVCIQSPCEAEQQLADMQQAGLIDAVLSEDGDTLIAGAQTVVGQVK